MARDVCLAFAIGVVVRQLEVAVCTDLRGDLGKHVDRGGASLVGPQRSRIEAVRVSEDGLEPRRTGVADANVRQARTTGGVGDQGAHVWDDTAIDVRAQEVVDAVAHDRPADAPANLPHREIPYGNPGRVLPGECGVRQETEDRAVDG